MIMKLTNNKYYLIFNLLGWILLFFVTLAGPKIFLNTKELATEIITYIWAESILCAILAYLSCFIVSYYIDLKVDFKSNIKRHILKIVFVFILTQIIYSLIIWPVLDFFAELIKQKSTPITLVGKTYNVFYFLTLFSIWLFVFLTIKIYHQLKSVQLKQLKLEANLKESQLNTLKGQINPHFIFNSLNNIRGLILEDTRKSREMITRLSEMLRYSLTKNDIDAISLTDELEMVDNYIAISKIQMEDRLQFDKNIELNPQDVKIPPMIIQMLVENAAKHGISNLKNGGIISLNIKQKDNKLLIEVSNPGQLSIDSKSTQLGLKNIQQRLALLYKEAANFYLEEQNSQVLATIQIPL